MGRPFEERGLHADVVARVPDRISALLSLTWSDSLHAPGWSDSLPMTTDPAMPGMISLRGTSSGSIRADTDFMASARQGASEGLLGGSELSPTMELDARPPSPGRSHRLDFVQRRGGTPGTPARPWRR